MSGSSSRLVVSKRVGTGESSRCGRRVNCAGNIRPHVVTGRTSRGHHLDIRSHQPVSRGRQPDSTWSSSGPPVVINWTSRGRQPDSTWSSSGSPVVIKSHQLDSFCPADLKLPSGLIHLKLHPCVNWNWINLTVLTVALYRISETVPFSDVGLLV